MGKRTKHRHLKFIRAIPYWEQQIEEVEQFMESHKDLKSGEELSDYELSKLMRFIDQDFCCFNRKHLNKLKSMGEKELALIIERLFEWEEMLFANCII